MNWQGKTPTAAEWRDILEKHAKYLRGDDGGECANLTSANLYGADLYGADLTGADLTGAYLIGANLTGANLTRANLTSADLTGADLTGANLTSANLTGANLTRANLTGADLTGADLTRAYLTSANMTLANMTLANLTGADLTRLISFRRICPEVGSFTAWKRLRDDLIAQLEIPAKAKRVGGVIGRKCRAESAKVVAIWKGKKKVREGFSMHDAAFRYVVGKIVKPSEPYSDDARIECASGIHFFMSRLEAEEYK